MTPHHAESVCVARKRRVFCVLLGAATILGCAASGDRSGDGLVREFLQERFTVARLAHQSVWRACEAVDTTALVHRMRCAQPPGPGDARFDDLTTALARAASARSSDTSLASLHAEALSELMWHSRIPARAAAAVDLLQESVRRDAGNAALWNDLAVAYLTQGEHEQSLLPLLRALDAVERARRLQNSAAVLFNRALILERLYLYDTARQAWQAYLDTERDGRWRREAETHVRSIDRLTVMAAPPMPTPDLLARSGNSALVAYVRQNPQAGRELGLDLLGEWGSAIRNGDSVVAAQALTVVSDISASMDTIDGDRSLSLALRAIHAAKGSAARTRVLGEAHRNFAKGFAEYARASYDEAAGTLALAEDAMRGAGSPTYRWAALYRGTAEVNRGAYGVADSVLRRVTVEASPGEPALQGKATWMLGVSLTRRGSHEAANMRYREAMPSILRSGERENAGVLSYLLSQSLDLAGRPHAGRIEALRSLRLLSPFRNSRFLGNNLGAVASYARNDGLHLAALALMDEVVAATARLDKPQVMAWAHSERARDLLAVGDLPATRAALARARPWIDSMSTGLGRDQIGAYVRSIDARALMSTAPQRASDLLAGVVADYRATNNDLLLPEALHEGAMAALRAGDSAVARARLSDAVSMVEARRDLFPSGDLRASFFDTMEEVFDAMMKLELANGRPDEALAYLERARAAAWDGDSRRSLPSARALRDVQSLLGDNDLMVAYALLDDRLIVWGLSRGARHYHAVAVGRDSVTSLVRRFHTQEKDPTGTRQASARLFELLIRPIERDLATVRTLVVIPDRELWRVPFAALWDASRREHLIERVAVATLPSATFLQAAVEAGRRTRRSAPNALVVGDPAFDSLALPGLARLQGAAREAREVAEHYGQARVLTDTAARRDDVVAELPRHTLFHFAGHAIENAQQPELSHLVLARAGPLDDGTLTAREISGLRLSNLGMVVLSGCSTLDARATHVGAVAGLAYSFVRAGVPATVSSLWDVNDESTKPLLVAFHRHLAAGRPAVEALRAAQLASLRSPVRGESDPRSWAAFIYTGR